MKKHIRKIVSRKTAFIAAAAVAANIAYASIGGITACGTGSGKSLCKDASHEDRLLSVVTERRTGLTLAEEIRLAETIIAESRNYNLDPLFVAALIDTESSFYNWSRSNRGAMGLMQIMPTTALELTDELKIKWRGEATLYDPYVNIRLGVHYYSTLLEMYGNDERKALAAYSCGPQCVDARILSGAGVPRKYTARVLSSYDSIKQETNF